MLKVKCAIVTFAAIPIAREMSLVQMCFICGMRGCMCSWFEATFCCVDSVGQPGFRSLGKPKIALRHGESIAKVGFGTKPAS